MKPLLVAIGAVCCVTGAIVGVLMVVVFLDEWLTPPEHRRRGKG